MRGDDDFPTLSALTICSPMTSIPDAMDMNNSNHLSQTETWRTALSIYLDEAASWLA